MGRNTEENGWLWWMILTTVWTTNDLWRT